MHSAIIEKLKNEVCKANQALEQYGLAPFTFGNVSGFAPEAGLVAIKPSGVSYAELKPSDIVVLDLNGQRVEGSLKPSSDTPTHLALYAAFNGIRGIAHTHSTHAVMFAQALRPIPCLGTTHADYFQGSIPVTRPLSKAEIENNYERNTGLVIAETFRQLEPHSMPAVLVAHHGPFTWGKSPADSVHNAAVLEEIARTAAGTLMLNPASVEIPDCLRDKHFLRKHGPSAYYGQN